MRETLFETRFCFSVLCVLSRRGTRLHARLRQVKVSWVRGLGVFCQSVTEFFHFQTHLLLQPTAHKFTFSTSSPDWHILATVRDSFFKSFFNNHFKLPCEVKTKPKQKSIVGFLSSQMPHLLRLPSGSAVPRSEHRTRTRTRTRTLTCEFYTQRPEMRPKLSAD